MRRKNRLIGEILLLTLSLTAWTTQTVKKIGTSEFSDAAKLLTEVKTTQFFTDEKIADEDIQKILSAGVNAPSAMNTQPWHFTAVTDEEVTAKLADAMSSMKPPAMKGDAPLTIVISCEEGAELSAGLAVQNMSAEAQPCANRITNS